MKELPPLHHISLPLIHKSVTRHTLLTSCKTSQAHNTPQATADTQKQTWTPEHEAAHLTKKTLLSVSGLHKVSLNRHKRGSVKVHFLASTPRTMGGWVGLHLYVLSPVFHPVNGMNITSGRRQQMVVSALNGLLVSKRICSNRYGAVYKGSNCTGIW